MANTILKSMQVRLLKITRVIALVSISFLFAKGGVAQDTTGKAGKPVTAQPSASDLAKQTQNPIASLISFPIESNWDMGVGEREATSTLVNIQPVIPFAASKKTNVVLRIIMPLMSQPSSENDGSRINGMGDIIFSAFFTPAKSRRVIFGYGPVFLLPSATDARLGTEKFGIGPTAVALIQPGKWSFGLLVNQVWSVSGANDRPDVNRTYIQPFLHYNLGSGLSLGASAEATGNWEAKEQKWSSTVLFNVSKVTVLGKRPVNFKIASGPTFGPEEGPNWRFRFVANFLFPK